MVKRINPKNIKNIGEVVSTMIELGYNKLECDIIISDMRLKGKVFISNNKVNVFLI